MSVKCTKEIKMSDISEKKVEKDNKLFPSQTNLSLWNHVKIGVKV